MAASNTNQNRASGSNKSDKGKQQSQEQIVAGFNELRQQQRQMIGKISEISDEKKEHTLVAETLKEMEKDRKCFRMIGGVLVERTVGEVLPALTTNIDQMTKLLATLEVQVEKKGKEILDYKAKYDIKIQGESDKTSANKPTEDSKTSGNIK